MAVTKGKKLGAEDPIERRVALAVAAHPDDIEFGMAGTLLRLAEAGYSLHYLNLSTGSCGSTKDPVSVVRRVRRKEAKEAAAILGATWHPPLVDDLEIFYEDKTLRRLSAKMREIAPTLILTHSPQDYMEDHTNTSRLTVTAAFSRGMRNYLTSPKRQPINGKVTLYHGMPHGLCDQLAQPVVPELFVETTSVVKQKQQALEAHRSQKDWLDESQGMDSYVSSMLKMSRAVGKMSKRFQHAEGWRRHLHIGFCDGEDDPLQMHLENHSSLSPTKNRRARFYVA
jgi:LmbE family N-acetylglucosaminyl deacetylase